MEPETYLGGRILIVDDEASIVVLLERMLSRAGYSFLASTTDSREAEGLFKTFQPDLVLLDLMMPHVDGFGVMEQILANSRDEAYIPILVLTADVAPQALHRALSSGARDFLTKPFDQTELLLRVKNLLETRFLYQSLAQQVAGLEQLSTQAQDAVRTRDQSLSEISHDLGQPLTALRLTTSLLSQDIEEGSELNQDRLRVELARIDSAAEQLAAMVSELSDLARLQLGRDLVLQRGQVDIASLIHTTVDQYNRRWKRHRIRVNSLARELTGEWDEVRLQRALSNLVDNAIKYSPRGGEIVIGLESVSEHGRGQAKVTVTDEGIGIPESDLPHVFDRFYRAANVTTTSIHGSGIGLAGVRQIIQQHGGSITITSEEGAGSEVTILLPLRTADE
jgi:signal transduction histidine kinase